MAPLLFRWVGSWRVRRRRVGTGLFAMAVNWVPPPTHTIPLFYPPRMELSSISADFFVPIFRRRLATGTDRRGEIATGQCRRDPDSGRSYISGG